MTPAAAAFAAYCAEVARVRATGRATEPSYRAALQTLVGALAGRGFAVVNEPAQVECGAPDLIVTRGGAPVGYVECKDLGADLDRAEASEQLARYRAGLPNLILTDHLEFRLYREGERVAAARLARLDARGEVAAEDGGAAEGAAALFAAFLAAEPAPVADPRALARSMAGRARLLRDGVERVFAREGGEGPLHDMLSAYREVLIASLSPAEFADLQAQTAAYGLFAARCMHDPQAGPFSRRSAVFAETTPFLRDLFGRVAGPGVDPRIAWIVDDLALLLERADMAAVLEDFGRRTRREDPVVHFYEDFLAAYDPALREARGVYYTPEPVVSYVVASVDRLLRERFGLADGLADISEGGPGAGPRVLILDPAAGTGTFLREAVASIRRTVAAKGLGGAWPDYVRDHLLPRLSGFELLMAPYAVCHLKLALEIGGGARFALPDDRRLGVYLTSALEEAHEETPGPLFAREIAREAAGADSVKRERPVMAVIGNPPYSGHSANKGAWIRGLLRGRDGAANTGSYFELDGKPLGERNPKWLNDDYVKFIRFAQWRIERTGEGVLGFVTNHSYLDNPTFRGMRRSLMASFDEIYALDLHGNARKKERAPGGGEDENVFDIRQGVAIGLFVKRGGAGGGPARVFHAELWGAREAGPGGGKYGWLAENDVGTTDWTELAPNPPLYLFAPRDEALRHEYEAGFALPDIFPVNSVGIVTTHDQFAISWTDEDAAAKVERLLSTGSEAEARAIWRLCAQDQWRYDRAKRDLADGSWRRRIEPILYRPFDRRVTVFDGAVAVNRRVRVMRHMLAGPNTGLCVGRAGQVIGSDEWDVVFASRNITDLNLFRRGGNCLFPLYVRSSGADGRLGDRRAPNLAPEFVAAARDALGAPFLPEGGGLESGFGPEDVFHYIYAVLHSPEYRRRYAGFLKSDFPRIPPAGDRALFAELAGLGRALAALHLMEAEAPEPPAFPAAGSNRVDKVRYAPPDGGAPGRVWINADQFFDGVAPETWAFTIGGYRPAEKWLRDRRRRRLSWDDIAQYRRICAALAETPRVMARIDAAIAAAGGWPLA